ncbi:MAG: hypothetical protein LBD07_00335 [Spirochaetaceae bacterium]|nr:hypothetical protein [Spirochaetaceae bacterium]
MDKILFIILLALILIVAVVSVWALLIRPRAAPQNPDANGIEQPETEAASSIKTFNGIGRLRVPLKTDSGAESTLIISPVFLYNSADRALTEELAARLRDFRKITQDYLASIPANDPQLSDDDLLKEILLERYNAVLRLGHIESLYFTDFMIIN